MTEQEKREKAIDEIFEVITEWANKAIVRSYAGASVLNTHNALELSKKIYTIFARKEEEVQKKTAKRFLKMLYDMGVDRQTVETCGFYDVNGSALARFVSQEFGVEVQDEGCDD